MNFRFVLPIPVRWADVDDCGVVNNATYLTYVEQTRWHYFDQRGLLRGRHFPFVLGETTVRYERSLNADSILTVSAAIRRLGGASFDMEFELRDADQLSARVSATLVWCDPGGRPMRIPDEARDTIADFEGL